jgi:hypothetical protein
VEGWIQADARREHKKHDDLNCKGLFARANKVIDQRELEQIERNKKAVIQELDQRRFQKEIDQQLQQNTQQESRGSGTSIRVSTRVK